MRVHESYVMGKFFIIISRKLLLTLFLDLSDSAFSMSHIKLRDQYRESESERERERERGERKLKLFLISQTQ